MSSKCNRLLHSHDIPSFEEEPDGRILPVLLVRVVDEAPAALGSAEDMVQLEMSRGEVGEISMVTMNNDSFFFFFFFDSASSPSVPNQPNLH